MAAAIRLAEQHQVGFCRICPRIVIAYVESNYVLELAFLQEQHDACEELLQLAESGALDLVVPAYCIGEPYEKLARQAKRRAELHQALSREVREMKRSRAYAGVGESTDEFATLLIASGENERKRLEQVLQRLLKTAIVVPLDGDVLASAIEAQGEAGLSPQDAIVFASVMSHVGTSDGEKVFLNRNTKDFLVPDVEEALSRHRCKLITSFTDGLGLVKHHLKRKS